MNISKQAVAILCLLWFTAGTIFSQDYESIDGALIYDHDPSTKLGDDVFGTLISDLEHDFPGRNSHGGYAGVYRSFCNFPLRGNFSGYRGLG